MYPEDSFEFTSVEREPFDLGLFLAGVLTGAAIGAGVALLFAPESGEEARQDIAAAGSAVRDKVTSGVSNVTEHVGETVHGARSAVEDWISHTREALEETRHRLDAAVDAGRTAYEEKKIELDAQVDASLEA